MPSGRSAPVDLLSPAEKKVTDREYRAQCRGQKKLDERNQKMLADGVASRKTKFETQKQFLRNAISEVSASACSLDEFQKILMKRFNISLKISRGRFSYLHPERGKYITGQNLGTHFEESYLRPYLKKIPDIHLVSPIQFFLLINQLLKISKSFPLLYSLNLTYGLYIDTPRTVIKHSKVLLMPEK